MKKLLGVLAMVAAVGLGGTLPQPVNATRYYTQFELRLMQIMRMDRWIESPGAGSAAGSADAGASSSSGSAGSK